jgi:hypothetical protein
MSPDEKLARIRADLEQARDAFAYRACRVEISQIDKLILRALRFLPRPGTILTASAATRGYYTGAELLADLRVIRGLLEDCILEDGFGERAIFSAIAPALTLLSRAIAELVKTMGIAAARMRAKA